MSGANIAVIVVNYGTAELAIKAVESVLACTHGGRHVEIHLVDNASPDGDAERLSKAHAKSGWGTGVTLWLEAENHGFGRGNNLVLRALDASEVPPDYVFLLNPDAHLDNEAVDALAGYLDAHPDVGVAGAAVAMPDGKSACAAFRFPSIRSEFARAMDFGLADRLFRTKPRALEPDRPAGPVDWVTGAAVMFRFKALREVDFFDPVFFLYFEEVDLMRRLTNAGWAIHYQPEARVIHYAGAATNVRSAATERRRQPPYLYRSWRRYFTKTHGAFMTLVAAAGVPVAMAAGRVIAALRRRPTQAPLNYFTDQWRYVLAPMLALRGDATYDADMARISDADMKGIENRNPSGIGFWALVAEDFRTHESTFLSQGFWAVFWHRFGNWRMSIRPKLVRVPFSAFYWGMYRVTQWLCGIDLPYTVIVGRRLKLEHFGGMVLVADQIGDDVIIRQNTTFGLARLDNRKGRPTIGDGVEIGAGAVIIGQITVGANAVVGANSVVTRDVPMDSVVAGVPARVLSGGADD